MWLTCVGVSVRILLGLALAFLLNSQALRRWHLTTPARLLLIVPWATPPVVAIIVWRWMLDPRVGSINHALAALGIVDQPIPFLSTAHWVWPSIILIITWNTLPLVTLTFLARPPVSVVGADRGGRDRRGERLPAPALHLSAAPEAGRSSSWC